MKNRLIKWSVATALSLGLLYLAFTAVLTAVNAIFAVHETLPVLIRIK
jgi:hypothetical protein